MSNMSYCQFENTYRDLQQCYLCIDDTDLSDNEKKYRYFLIKLCKEIAEEFGDEEEND